MADERFNRRLGWAWALLCAVLAVHVTDEALTDFLGWWNPTIESLRGRIPWIPLPTFRFDVWLGLLWAAIAALFWASRFAFRGASAMKPLAVVFSVIMIGNGVGHILLSLYLGRLAPGVYSAPLLLVAGANLLGAALAAKRG